MEDSRLDQIAALADDARCLAADIADELAGEEHLKPRCVLTDVRLHLNVAIQGIHRLKGM